MKIISHIHECSAIFYRVDPSEYLITSEYQINQLYFDKFVHSRDSSLCKNFKYRIYKF